MKCRIIKHIAVFGANQHGLKELNLVSWFNKDAKLDIRVWSADHEHFKGGVTLSYIELIKLKDALIEWSNSEEAAEMAKNEKSTNKELYGLDEVMQNVITDLIKRGR